MSNAKVTRLPFFSAFHNGHAIIFYRFFSFSFLLILLIAFSGSVYATPDKEIWTAAKEKFAAAKVKFVSKATAAASRWAKGRLLVIPRAGLTAKEFDKSLKLYGVKSRHKLAGLNAQVYELSDGVDEVKVLEKLKRDRRFKAAELDRLVEPAQTVTDPAFNNSWALPKIQAPTAWDLATGDGVTIAILDTGVDSTHPDLAANMIPGWNIYSNNEDTSDVYGHGTKVAGAAAAAANNGTGSVGVAWNARILPVRISMPDGRAYLSDIARGIYWAADNGAKVANLSYGGVDSITVQSAANYMRSKGGVVVMSAGNSGTLNSFPPSEAIVVASATDRNDARASWSSYGPYVDVAAPGVSIYTTTRGGGYAYVSGTSFSSPIVAATTALLFSINPDLAPADIDQILVTASEDLGDPGFDQIFGNGRINAANAVNAAHTRLSADQIAPAISIASPTGGTVSGNVPVDVNYSDNKGVVRVDLYINDRKAIEDTQPPFAFAWDTTTVANGSYTLVAYAFDAAGNQGASSPVTVTVKNSDITTTEPLTKIRRFNLKDGQKVSRYENIRVAADNNARKINLRINGNLIATVDNKSLNYRWNSWEIQPLGSNIAVTAEVLNASGDIASVTAIVQN